MFQKPRAHIKVRYSGVCSLCEEKPVKSVGKIVTPRGTRTYRLCRDCEKEPDAPDKARKKILEEVLSGRG